MSRGKTGVRYSENVERALAEVCPSTDPIDSPDFDPVDFVNECFTTERSLEKLPTFVEETNRKLTATESRLMEAVRTQATTANTAASDLQQARTSVTALFSRVGEIREKAEESEDMVRSLCVNIRQLDTAKTNLSDSIRTLKSVQLWIMALQELRHAKEVRDYGRCYDNLRQAQAYKEKFAEYSDLPKIRELSEKQGALCKQLEFDIKNLFIEGDLVSFEEDTLRDACLVIDAMGPDSVQKIRARFIARELAVYDTKFKRGTDDAKLDRTERRYGFIRSLLENNDHLFSYVFPRHWCVPQELCVEFCVKTHKELTHQLQESAGSIEVAVLVFVLQKTIEVEKFLTTRNRWHHGETGPAGEPLPEYRYGGMILVCFEDHMGLYVREEDRAMEDSIAEQVASDTWPDANDARPGVVLPSSEDLFVFIKESLKRVVSLSQQSTLLEMTAIWRKHLINYANILTSQLPEAPTTPEHFRRACVIINTADNCMSTSQALNEEVTAKLTVEEVDYEDVTDAFSQLYGSGVKTIGAGIQKLLEPSVAEFMSVSFAAPGRDSADVADESKYITDMRRVLTETVQTCASLLNSQVLRFMLDKLAAGWIPQWASTLYRLRRVTDTAVNQIRIDNAALEKIFLQLPNAGNPERFANSQLTNYTKIVRREFDRITRSLKVLQCDLTDQFAQLYYEIVDADDRSLTDFSRLLELKGVKREDLRPWVTQLAKKNVPEATKRDSTRDTMQGGFAEDEKAVAAAVKSRFEKLKASSIMVTLKSKMGKDGDGGEGQ